MGVVFCYSSIENVKHPLPNFPPLHQCCFCFHLLARWKSLLSSWWHRSFSGSLSTSIIVLLCLPPLSASSSSSSLTAHSGDVVRRLSLWCPSQPNSSVISFSCPLWHTLPRCHSLLSAAAWLIVLPFGVLHMVPFPVRTSSNTTLLPAVRKL